ncbi:MAG TPA: heme-degrading domain-containing protein [Chthoniobacterales bacterium]
MALNDDVERIARQERELTWTGFETEAAWLLGQRLRELAFSRGHPVAIEVRRFGQQLFYTALAGATPDNADWIRRKSNTVQRFHRSSYAVGLELKQKNASLNESLPPADYATHGGAFPLNVAGAGTIGVVTVSGLPQRQDHELVVEAMCSQLNRNYAELCLPEAG